MLGTKNPLSVWALWVRIPSRLPFEKMLDAKMVFDDKTVSYNLLEDIWI